MHSIFISYIHELLLGTHVVMNIFMVLSLLGFITRWDDEYKAWSWILDQHHHQSEEVHLGHVKCATTHGICLLLLDSNFYKNNVDSDFIFYNYRDYSLKQTSKSIIWFQIPFLYKWRAQYVTQRNMLNRKGKCIRYTPFLCPCNMLSNGNDVW